MEINTNLVEEFKDINKESSHFVKHCAKLVQEINLGRLTIVGLVEELGPLLVNTLPQNRELGTWILAQVLENLPASYLDEKQLEFICAFYTDRLKDHHQVIPAVLVGVLALARFENFPKESAPRILSALFQNVACRQQQEQDRYNIYKIFEILLDKCETEVCSMSFDFVYGVITAVDSERNPKNLIFLFDWFPKFLKVVNLGHLTEEAFEVLACYFPVDFKAPPSDSNSTTRDQLADALAPCLTAIPEFSAFCFPLSLEKLDSSLEVAKLDSLKLLEIGCSTFEASAYVQHSREIWSQIQKELFNTPTSSVEAACLRTLTTVIRKISNDPSISNNLKDVVDTIKGNLLPDGRMFNPSAKILISIAQGSSIACDFIVKEIAPILINSFLITNTASHKVLFLNYLVRLLLAYLNFHNEIEFEELQNVQILCMKAALDSNLELRNVGFEGLSQICAFLTQDVRISLYQSLESSLCTNACESVLNCFKELARYYPNEVQEKLCNKFEIENEEVLKSYLNGLSVIITQEFFTEILVNIMICYLGKSLNVAKVVIESLHKVLQEYDNDYLHKTLSDKNVVSSLVDRFLLNDFDSDIKCCESVSFILKTIISKEEPEKQKAILSCELSKLKNLNSSNVFVLKGVLSNIRREVSFDYNILNDLTELIKNESNEGVKNAGVQLIANLLNKCPNDILVTYLEQFDESNPDLVLTSWITKALIMRNHLEANKWTERLLQLLDEDERVAPFFGIIINDHFDCLSLKSYTVRSVLYQQKFFTLVCNKLCAWKSEKTSHLLALGYMLESAPKQVVLLHFKKILNRVLLILECREASVLVSLLELVKDLIVMKETCIEENLKEFLTQFLKLTTFEQSMKVRVLALQCLQKITCSFPVPKLILHKSEVLTTLRKVVDDKKRIVRKEAVEAVSLWFLVDAPL